MEQPVDELDGLEFSGFADQPIGFPGELFESVSAIKNRAFDEIE
jgi:hypothetical protein